MATEMELHDDPKPMLLTDNDQVLAWIKEPNSEHSRSKHLGLAKNWMHEQIVVNKVSRATYLNTTSMIADIFTKSPGAMVGGGATWKAFAKMLVY